MVWNIKLPTLDKAKFMDALKATAGRAAETIASMKPKAERKEPDYTVTAKAGKPGVPYRRIIAQKSDKVWFVQSGINMATGAPRLVRIERHRFLHATKGWRVYNGGLPGIGRSRTPVFARNPAKQYAAAPWRPIAKVAKDGTITPLKAAA